MRLSITKKVVSPGEQKIIGEFEEETRQAEIDAALLATNPPSKFRTRRSVATFQTCDLEKGRGIANEYAYNRADAALTLMLEGKEMGWDKKAAELLATKDGGDDSGCTNPLSLILANEIYKSIVAFEENVGVGEC